MPANQPNKHAVRLTSEEIEFAIEALRDYAGSMDKDDPDSRRDAKRMEEIAEKLGRFDQCVDVYVVTRKPDDSALVDVFLDENIAKEKAKRLTDASNIHYYYVVRVPVS